MTYWTSPPNSAVCCYSLCLENTLILKWATIWVFAMWSMSMYHPNCVFCQSNCTRLLLFEQVNLVCQQWAEHCICTFSLPVQMPHLAKVGVCWQAAHEGRTSYWILGSTSPPSPTNLPLGESGIRYNLRVSENFCDPQYQGQEIKWNYVTLPPYAARNKNTKKSARSKIFDDEEVGEDRGDSSHYSWSLLEWYVWGWFTFLSK